ncbi:MAG: hypothetical protein P4L79_17035 [Legionella sp.]|uniref:hypothetical protein n=1 Tax=Legionella sp. TaxID=459 RepID=UPI00283D9D6A|nr:hypothetical protein [Legionella sp.]
MLEDIGFTVIDTPLREKPAFIYCSRFWRVSRAIYTMYKNLYFQKGQLVFFWIKGVIMQLRIYSEFSWNKSHSIRENINQLMTDYIPYKANIFSKKNHIEEAEQILDFLKKDTLSEIDIYLCVQALRQKLIENNEYGEFKRRLDFAVEQMENQNTFLKGLGTVGQTIKTIFGP